MSPQASTDLADQDQLGDEEHAKGAPGVKSPDGELPDGLTADGQVRG